MAFSSYEELMKVVEERRQDYLTLEIDLGGQYSQEYEEAKTELKQAKALRLLAGDKGFLADNTDELEAKVAALKPDPRSVWVRFRRISLQDWALLVKQQSLSPLDQYEKVLPDTFVGVYGSNPAEDSSIEPLSTDPGLLSNQSEKGILPGGSLHQVVQAFMNWQNSGGEVTIHPTRSGQD